jgi:DNA mismatch endonuclease, patch repair protein
VVPVVEQGGRTVNLGGGSIVPYPVPTSAAASAIGKANRRRDTKPEVQLRSLLHRAGLRFRKDHLIRARDVRVRVDVAFTRAQVAVFVDGCFWHGCPEHQNIPKSNPSYWVPKLAANKARDRRVDEALTAEGWTVIRVWEHEPVAEAASRVAIAVSGRRGG